jgi:3-deoxy-7-phosphoheptulonate synthase
VTIKVSDRIKLAVKHDGAKETHVKVGDVEVGGNRIVVIAGPCSVESREQLLETAREIGPAGASMIRGGAFKPRTLPYSFQGLGEEGLKILAEARDMYGLPVVTEVMSPDEVDLVEKYADVLQIGARNVQNFALLKRVGRSRKPVLLKRGLSSTVEEWLGAAEYILHGGNEGVILCERGLRSFGKITRFTLDLAIVPLLKEVSHLPVIVDPSHGTGQRSLVSPMARAAVAAGADGLIVEVHPRPEEAKSDGAQSLTPDGFRALMKELRPVVEAMERTL